MFNNLQQGKLWDIICLWHKVLWLVMYHTIIPIWKS
jgi:hypothetical protein